MFPTIIALLLEFLENRTEDKEIKFALRDLKHANEKRVVYRFSDI